jgi:hypothetical protein
VLGDVGKPDLIGRLGVEVPVDVVVVDRRTWRLAGPAPLTQDARGDPLQRTQPLDAVLRSPVPGGVQFVGDEPVAELGVIGVDVDGGIVQVRVLPDKLVRLKGAVASAAGGLPNGQEAVAGQAYVHTWNRLRDQIRHELPEGLLGEFDALFTEMTPPGASRSDLFGQAGAANDARLRLQTLVGWLDGAITVERG